MTSVDLTALQPPPSGNNKWSKIIWFVKDVVVQSAGYLAYSYGMQMRGLDSAEPTLPPDEWRRFVVTWDDITSNVNADVAVYTVDVINFTGGQIDNTWTTQDHADVRDALATFAGAIAPVVSSNFRNTQTKAYRMAWKPMPTPEQVASPGFKDDPFADSGPPTYIQAETTLGGASQGTAHQVCSSITEEVPLRRHWGRFYCPPVGAGVGTAGRFASVNVDLLATSWNTCLTSLAAKDFYTVVPSTMADKYPTRTLSNVTGIHVDDVPDIIRRRRPKYVAYRKRYDALTP